jgi:hypothetical protein
MLFISVPFPFSTWRRTGGTLFTRTRTLWRSDTRSDDVATPSFTTATVSSNWSLNFFNFFALTLLFKSLWVFSESFFFFLLRLVVVTYLGVQTCISAGAATLSTCVSRWSGGSTCRLRLGLNSRAPCRSGFTSTRPVSPRWVCCKSKRPSLQNAWNLHYKIVVQMCHSVLIFGG